MYVLWGPADRSPAMEILKPLKAPGTWNVRRAALLASPGRSPQTGRDLGQSWRPPRQPTVPARSILGLTNGTTRFPGHRRARGTPAPDGRPRATPPTPLSRSCLGARGARSSCSVPGGEVPLVRTGRP